LRHVLSKIFGFDDDIALDVDNEAVCKFVSSRGILKSCDIFPVTPVSGSPKVTDFHISKLTAGSIVYVHSSAILDFYKNYFPKIKHEFVLVSGDSTKTMPYDQLSENEFEDFINDRRLLHWFCQNADLSNHPKFSPIPVGLDYHTLSSIKEKHKWGEKRSPVEQESLLIKLAEEAPPTEERIAKIYATFHFYMTGRYGYDRVDALANIQNEAVFYERSQMERQVTWAAQAQYAFVASPLSNGLDAHRTWEALVLGCIPVIKKSPIAPLLENLPALIVDDWHEVTQERLDDYLNYYRLNKHMFKFDQLTLKYWVDRFRAFQK